MGPTPLLHVEGLKVTFRSEAGESTPVTGATLSVQEGRTTALVGESGSGKSVSSLAIMGLLPRPAGRVSAGSIHFRRSDGTVIDLASQPPEVLRRLRGREIAMIFQEPMTSLNPVRPVGEQIAEQIRLHMGLDGRASLARAVEMLGLVEIPDAARWASDYPHQMSGGMRQRVMIAMAMSCNPRLLIADEPTTALDVTIQSQILALIDRLRKEHGMGVLFITHNLGVVAEIADEVTVMYAGEAVEAAQVKDLFHSPKHPYTRALMDCLPSRARSDATGRRLIQSIPGTVGNAFKLSGCRFAPRCAHANAVCNDVPKVELGENGRLIRCRRWSEL